MDLGPLERLDPDAFPPIDLGAPLADRVASDLAQLAGVDDVLRGAADALTHAAADGGDSGLDGLLDELAGAIGIVLDPGAERELDAIATAAADYSYALDVRAHFLPPDLDAPTVHDAPDPDDRFDDNEPAPGPEPEPAPGPEPEPAPGPEPGDLRPTFLE